MSHILTSTTGKIQINIGVMVVFDSKCEKLQRIKTLLEELFVP